MSAVLDQTVPATPAARLVMEGELKIELDRFYDMFVEEHLKQTVDGYTPDRKAVSSMRVRVEQQRRTLTAELKVPVKSAALTEIGINLNIGFDAFLSRCRTLCPMKEQGELKLHFADPNYEAMGVRVRFVMSNLPEEEILPLLGRRGGSFGGLGGRFDDDD